MHELIVESVDTLADLRDDWTRLAERTGNVFSTWEWADAWLTHIGAGSELALATCIRPGGEVVGILPFYVASARPARTLRFVGQGPADRLGPVCAPEDRENVVRALMRALAERRWGWQVLFASELPVEEGWGELLGGRVWGTQPSPVLDLTGLDWDGYLATRSSNARQQIRRRERRLRQAHEVGIRTTSDPGRVQEDLEIFDHLHRARWGSGSQAFAGDWGRFARDFAQRASERGWLNLRFLDLDRQPAACYFGFRYMGVENYWQAGRDPRFDELSVGAVLLADTIREAIESGAHEFRFLRGDEAYKLRYAGHDPGLEARVLSRGLLGTMSVRGAATARSLLSYERRQRLARLLP